MGDPKTTLGGVPSLVRFLFFSLPMPSQGLGHPLLCAGQGDREDTGGQVSHLGRSIA